MGVELNLKVSSFTIHILTNDTGLKYIKGEEFPNFLKANKDDYFVLNLDHSTRKKTRTMKIHDRRCRDINIDSHWPRVVTKSYDDLIKIGKIKYGLPLSNCEHCLKGYNSRLGTLK